MRNISLAIMILSILLLCGCNPLTRVYRPMSDKEKNIFKIANRNIFPDDVRKAPSEYQGTMVAWTGIVVERKFIKLEDRTEAQFVLKHHYYNWIENPGFEDERIFLSRKGEGIFRTSWKIKKRGRFKKIKKSSRKGNLLIVYGTPAEVNEDGSVVLDSKYLRAFNNKYFRTDKLDYGRPEPPAMPGVPQQTSAR